MENFRFKKKYGQNFLRDEKVLDNIVNSIENDRNYLVIEVGAGDGALTKKLLEKNFQVFSYEVDETLKSKLNLIKNDNFNYVINDFMKADVLHDIEGYSYDELIMVANLPYYITTPILEKVMSLNIFSKVVVMVQDEVARRLCSQPGNKDYAAFTILLDYFFEREYLFFVNKNSFYPVPGVDSAVVKLDRKTNLADTNVEKLKKVIYDSFRFKRKNLKNNLFDYDLNIVEKVLHNYGFSLNDRAEMLPLEFFVDLTNSL